MYGDNSSDNANGQQPPNGGQPAFSAPAGDTPTPPIGITDQQPTSSPELVSSSQPATSFGSDAPADNTATPSDNTTPTTPAQGPDELLDIKQQALQQLTPLVDHLDQSPREEFRTTMMMIQATDNQSLIGKAFEAAKKIEDDKERAQAFLDIINEINYFTQHHEQQ